VRVCSVHGCPELYPSTEGSRCRRHRRQADRARGTAAQRGYNSSGHERFRAEVLHRDPICVACGLAESTVADHHPRSRRELIALDLDPNDPEHGRGLCKPCHDRATAEHQPGGWAAR
jgi:5-methylcytosine-specific restriction enzyme A